MQLIGKHREQLNRYLMHFRIEPGGARARAGIQLRAAHAARRRSETRDEADRLLRVREPQPMNEYVELPQRYMRDVLHGSIPACKWVRLAVQRQVDDLQRVQSDDWPWIFDPDIAARPCAFIELLPHIKGRWAREGRSIDLEPWQYFILTTVFGWVHRETRLRRSLEAYEEEARKNGKSAKGSGLLLYMLTADGEHGAECYTAATTRDQARIVFDDAKAKAMAERSPGLRTHLGLAIMQHSLTVAHTSSKATPLAAEGSTLDGLNAACRRGGASYIQSFGKIVSTWRRVANCANWVCAVPRTRVLRASPDIGFSF